jgi:dihydrofolate reductase
MSKVFVEDAPFRAPVFVLTNKPRSPWERKGGTTFYFSNESIELALARAQKAAGIKDVRISGGASVIQQYLNAGLVDELDVQIAPMFLGKGMRLFDHIDQTKVKLEIVEAINSPTITHLQYGITKG